MNSRLRVCVSRPSWKKPGSGQNSVIERTVCARLSIIHACPYGSPQTKHSGMSRRCSNVEPDRHPAERINTGDSQLLLTTCGHRDRMTLMPSEILRWEYKSFMGGSESRLDGDPIHAHIG